GARVPARFLREADYRAAGEMLRRRVWDPIAARIAGDSIAFVVPDGALNLVSLAALPVGGNEYLIERGPTLHYLPTERDLVPDLWESRTGDGLLALGAPDFDTSPGGIGAKPGHARRPARDGHPTRGTGRPAGAAVRGGSPAGAGEPATRGERSRCDEF